MNKIILGLFVSLIAGSFGAMERILNARMGKEIGEAPAYFTNLCILTVISLVSLIFLRKTIVITDPFTKPTDLIFLLGGPICIFRFYQSIKLVKVIPAVAVSIFFSVGTVLGAAVIDIIFSGIVKPTFVIGCVLAVVGTILFAKK